MTPTNSTARTLTEHQNQTGEEVWKVERSASGRPMCRWCKKEVPAGHRTFCGDPNCVEQWRVRNSQSYARKKVFKRDRGVCKACACDTEAVRKRARALAPGSERDEFVRTLVEKGFDRHNLWQGVLWHMDHIVEVVNGGGTCGLENYQTLCLPCHKQKTRKLAKERAAARAASRQQSIGKLL
jgi:5-methylcytosine-specific restriction endonuclease McrA